MVHVSGAVERTSSAPTPRASDSMDAVSVTSSKRVSIVVFAAPSSASVAALMSVATARAFGGESERWRDRCPDPRP